jgi:hypothetical protein
VRGRRQQKEKPSRPFASVTKPHAIDRKKQSVCISILINGDF